jgi:hypothetical protein
MIKFTEEETLEIRGCITLMNSMILSGEYHSDSSLSIFRKTLNLIDERTKECLKM